MKNGVILDEVVRLILGERKWVLSKHQDIVQGGSLICFYQDFICKSYKGLVNFNEVECLF